MNVLLIFNISNNVTYFVCDLLFKNWNSIRTIQSAINDMI